MIRKSLWFYVQCTACPLELGASYDADGNPDGEYWTEGDAAAAWNRRAAVTDFGFATAVHGVKRDWNRGELMGEVRENGWHLRSDGYMTSECSYQRIEAMMGNRTLDNHGRLVFVKFMGGEEVDSRVYLPHPGECRVMASSADELRLDNPRKKWLFSCGHTVTLDSFEPPACCPVCGKLVTR